jgi:maltose O-acetyltransferase
MLGTMTWRERKTERPLPDERSDLQRMRDGDWFNVLGGTELFSLQEETMAPLRAINDAYWDDPQAAVAALADLIPGCAGDFFFRPPLVFEYREHMHIGKRTFINADFEAIGSGDVWIGDDVLIGPHARVYTPNHPLDPAVRAEGWEIGLPIRIEDRAWLGGSVVLCPGVTVGAGAVVAAGAVVTKDVPAGAIVGGNPARVIGHSG